MNINICQILLLMFTMKRDVLIDWLDGECRITQ